MPTFDAFLADQHHRFIDDLKAFVAQPSVAATGQGMRDMAALVQQRLERIGAAVRQIPTGGAPIVYAELGSGPRGTLPWLGDEDALARLGFSHVGCSWRRRPIVAMIKSMATVL